MTTALDSRIFGPLFSDPELAELFTDEAYLRALLEVEGALARAEARLDVIPTQAGEEISAAAGKAKIDPEEIARGTVRDGFPVIALVQALRRLVKPETAPYVHWGATTQDIMDTAQVLQLRGAIKVFERRLAEVGRSLAALAKRHRRTVLAARTHGQQALPLSFGLKAAGWLAPFVRHRERLDEILPRLLVVQFGGAAGTLAALGERGLEVMRALAEELGLGQPAMPWHTQRDAVVEFGGWLSLTTGSAAKMAQDVLLLAQTEVGEAAESAERGRGGSSTMPQKSNPITSELVVAAARTNAALLSSMHHAMIQEHERGTHGWQVEWLTLPQMVALAGGALKHALLLAENLQLDEARMRQNLAHAHDVVLAEAAVFALSKTMPRERAHELVQKGCATAVAEGRPLIDVVKEMAGAAADWALLADPANYLGAAERFLDRVLEQANRRFS